MSSATICQIEKPASAPKETGKYQSEDILQADGNIKKKRIYKIFTCDIPDPKGKRKCEQLAAEWAATKEISIATPNITMEKLSINIIFISNKHSCNTK